MWITIGGTSLTEKDYKDLISSKESNRKTAIEELNALKKQLNDNVKKGKVTKGSTEWKQAMIEIEGVQDEITSCEQELESLYDTLREDVLYKKFTDALAASEKLRNSVSSVLDLLEDESFYDDKGNLTSFGKVELAGQLSNMNQYQNDIKTLLDKQKQLDKDFKDPSKHLTGTEYKKATEENQKALQDTLKNMASTRSSIINIMKEQSKIRLDNNLDLIDSYKDLIKQQNDYYNYDKNLKKGQKEIDQIQARINALAGLTDAEIERMKKEGLINGK